MQRSQLSKSVGESNAGVLAGQRPAAAHLERAALAFRSQRRQQAVRRVDDERRLPLRRAGSVHAREERAAELALLEQLAAGVAAAGGGGDALLELVFRPPRLVRVARRTAGAVAVAHRPAGRRRPASCSRWPECRARPTASSGGPSLSGSR